MSHKSLLSHSHFNPGLCPALSSVWVKGPVPGYLPYSMASGDLHGLELCCSDSYPSSSSYQLRNLGRFLCLSFLICKMRASTRTTSLSCRDIRWVNAKHLEWCLAYNKLSHEVSHRCYFIITFFHVPEQIPHLSWSIPTPSFHSSAFTNSFYFILIFNFFIV